MDTVWSILVQENKNSVASTGSALASVLQWSNKLQSDAEIKGWHKAIDESKYTAAAFLDVLKAFDCVNHDVLLSKLACYGVVDNSLVWFASYLSCRWQRVCLQGLTSEWGAIHPGVLFPRDPFWVLYCSVYEYMNYLPSVVEGCQMNMYCDDMELHYSSSDLLLTQRGLQSDLDSADFWLQTNQLNFYVGKSHVMLIGS